MFFNTTNCTGGGGGGGGGGGATADTECGFVNCELLQTTDFGETWERVAVEGTHFIPHGEAGAFDSHTIYTAWSGDQVSGLQVNEVNY
jgi:hypothetical protein